MLDFRESLLVQAEDAFIVLMKQANQVLDDTDKWLAYPAITRSDELKRLDVLQTVRDLGILPRRLEQELVHWKLDLPRILSREGLENELLNEIVTNMLVLVLFLAREKQESTYSYEVTKQAYSDLVRCNRLL